MKAIEFIESLQGKIKDENLLEMPANEYFETTAGKKIIKYLSEKVKVIDEKTFELTDLQITPVLEKNLLYRGRNFFSDMEALGFTCERKTCNQYESPVYRYIFKSK